MSSSAHHRICASDAVLPSRARMVSVAHWRTPLARIEIGIAAAAAAHRRSEQAEREQPMRLVAGELHAGRAAVFGADQVAACDPERVEKAPDVGGELVGALQP